MKVEIMVQLKGDKIWRKGLLWDEATEGPLPSELAQEVRLATGAVRVLETDAPVAAPMVGPGPVDDVAEPRTAGDEESEPGRPTTINVDSVGNFGDTGPPKASPVNMETLNDMARASAKDQGKDPLPKKWTKTALVQARKEELLAVLSARAPGIEDRDLTRAQLLEIAIKELL